MYIIHMSHWHNGENVLLWPERLGFNPRPSHTKDSKNCTWWLLAKQGAIKYTIHTQHYKIQIKSKWSNPGKGVMATHTPKCSSYWKRSLWDAFSYGQPTEIYYVYKGLNLFLWVNAFILSYLPLCSVLVYYGYTYANIGSQWDVTWLNIFLSINCTKLVYHKNRTHDQFLCQI